MESALVSSSRFARGNDSRRLHHYYYFRINNVAELV